LQVETLVNVAKPSMSSKIINSDNDFFGKLCVDAVLKVKSVNEKGEEKYPINAINILKAHGKSSRESVLIEGFALNCTVASQSMPKKILKAKIALLDFNLQKTKLGLGINVLIKDPTQLDKIRLREQDIIKERIELILKSGANVVLTTKGIDDMCLKYFVEKGVMAVRRCTKSDLKRIAKSTGGAIVTTLANLEGEESFDPSSLGTAEEVCQERIADDELILITGTSLGKSASIILRGANSFMLDEMDRSVHDVLSIVKRTLESKSIVSGGGAVEAALSIYLEIFAKTLSSDRQLAIGAFSEALQVIPKTLAVNSAFDAPDLVAKLLNDHYKAQTTENNKGLFNSGLDLEKGVVRDNYKFGVLEPTVSKVKSIKFATEAAITILRIDDLIKLNPKEPEQRRQH